MGRSRSLEPSLPAQGPGPGEDFRAVPGATTERGLPPAMGDAAAQVQGFLEDFFDPADWNQPAAAAPAPEPARPEPECAPAPAEVTCSPKSGSLEDGMGMEAPLLEAAPEPVAPAPEPAAPAARSGRARLPHAQAGEVGDFSSDDPRSANYRFRDTGYVPGSRKEMAALQIRTAAKEGKQVRSSQIDWDAIEQNPREAKALITKSHLFGQVDWETLKAGGMEPAAGFLVDRIYAAVGKEPSEDSPQARREYALGLETLRDRLEVCKTPDEVTKALDGLLDEAKGFVLNPEEQATYDQASAQVDALHEKAWAYRKEEEAITSPLNQVKSEISTLEYDQKKRERRGWKRDPELDARIQKLTPGRDELQAKLEDLQNQKPEFQDRWDGKSFGSTTSKEIHRLNREAEAIKRTASLRNLVENPLCRAWAQMGDRFINVMAYRSFKGSDAFRTHIATAKAGKIPDWSWAEKETARVPTSTKESARFQLQVADSYERVGGRPVTAASSAELKETFGLREAEYGLWVAEDFNSAKFHTERCAEGLADLADLLGVDDRGVSLGGHLAMGFGSRGQGAIGWRTTAPAATYFPMNRIINITKMSGGGSLGHEWSHSMDNILPERATGRPSGVHDFASENPELLPAGPLRDAMTDVVRAMTEGPHRRNEEIQYTGRDVLVAQQNIDRDFGFLRRPHIAQEIRDAGNVEQAVLRVKARFQSQLDRDGNMTRSAKMGMKSWATLAAAYYGKNPDGGKILVKAGEPVSRFAYEAANLDAGAKTPYWSTTREMFARAFQAWTEDRLRDMGRKNDYLSWHADNKYYVHPIFGPTFPFPEGEERERINKAFDKLAKAVRESGLLTTRGGHGA